SAFYVAPAAPQGLFRFRALENGKEADKTACAPVRKTPTTLMTTPIRPGSTPPRAPSAGAAAPTGPVRTQDIPRTPWNFFVYLNGDNNRESDAKDDLNEMEKMGSMPGRMNVFALVDGAAGTKSKDGHIAKSDGWSGGTRLMWIQKDPANSKKIVSREVQVD